MELGVQPLVIAASGSGVTVGEQTNAPQNVGRNDRSVGTLRMTASAGDLAGYRVFVAGGTGDVGERIVRALLNKQASVVVPARTPEKAERLREAVSDSAGLSFAHGNVGEPREAIKLCSEVLSSGPLHAVIVSLGGWWAGDKLANVSDEAWAEVMTNNLTSHFAVARGFSRTLEERGGMFVQLLGAAADYPVKGSGLVSISAAGCSMLGAVLGAEAAGTRMRVRQVQINSIVATRSRGAADPKWVTADEVGELIAGLIVEDDDAAHRHIDINAKP